VNSSLGKVTLVVIDCDFLGLLGLKAIGLSGNQFDFVLRRAAD